MSLQGTETLSKKCPHCGLVNPETSQRCDCGYDFGTMRVDPEMLAKARSRRRRRAATIVLAVVIPVLVYFLLTSVRNYSAVSSLLIAAGVFGLMSLNFLRLSRLNRQTRKSIEESQSKLKPPRH